MPEKPDPENFHFEEYKLLRAEINNTIEKIFFAIQTVPVISAAMFAWFAVNAIRQKQEQFCLTLPSDSIYIFFLLPALAAIGGGFSYFQHRHSINLGIYLLELENRFGYSNMGWEKRLRRKNPWVIVFIVSFWGIFFTLACYFAWLMVAHYGQLPPC